MTELYVYDPVTGGRRLNQEALKELAEQYRLAGEQRRLAAERELEKTNIVIAVLQFWADMIALGAANRIVPDLAGRIFSAEKVNRIVESIYWQFVAEYQNHFDHWTWEHEVECIPDFLSLDGAARLAFVQNLGEAIRKAHVE